MFVVFHAYEFVFRIKYLFLEKYSGICVLYVSLFLFSLNLIFVYRFGYVVFTVTPFGRCRDICTYTRKVMFSFLAKLWVHSNYNIFVGKQQYFGWQIIFALFAWLVLYNIFRHISHLFLVHKSSVAIELEKRGKQQPQQHNHR